MSKDDTSFDNTESISGYEQPNISFIPTQRPQYPDFALQQLQKS